jgi:thiol-disulfide isomerase/thioredoxin
MRDAWRAPAVFAAATALALACSCGRDEPGGSGYSAAGQSAAPPVRAEPADAARILEAVRGHRGEVVLLDFWATWCAPCIEALPKLVSWQREFGPEGLAVVSVSLDDPADAETRVSAFLSQERPPFETFILDAPNFDEFVQSVNASWSGGIPALFVYDHKGELRHEFVGAYTAEQVKRAFTALLAERAGGAQPGGQQS